MTDFLKVDGLTTRFGTGVHALCAVNEVSFTLQRGEILGLVGESGSGKSVTLRSLLGLSRRYGSTTGKVIWQGRDIASLPERDMRRIRGGEIAMIFQEPMTSLNPLLSVGRQIDETLRAHTALSRPDRLLRTVEMLDLVGIPSARARINDYPHQFSGGMRQRVMIAIALAARPKLLLADEPTTALDVTIQAQILDLISSLARDLDMGVVLVTHDLGVVAQTCDSIAVMYAGRIVEAGQVRQVLRQPSHPYTVGLMRSVPEDVAPRTVLYSVPGTPPSLANLPAGCAFAPRCQFAAVECRASPPPLRETPNGLLACLHPVTEGADHV